jgi:hypothetical protein
MQAHLFLVFCIWTGKMAITSYVICEKLLVVIDHRRTTDLDRSFQQCIKYEAS